MRAGVIVGSVLILSCTVFPSSAAAQERQGFWFGLGGGYGSADVSCDDCNGDREGSGVGYLRGGWTLNERTLIGAEFNLWTKSEEEENVKTTLNLYWVTGTITFYPSATNGFFVKGGAGISATDADVEVDGSKISADLGSGIGFVLGAGYDFRVSRRISVTPAFGFSYGRPGDLKLAGETLFTDFSQNVAEITIGIMFH